MPSGNDVTQRTDEQPAVSADLLELILQPSNIVAAWKQVRANKGVAGIDGMTIDDFPAWANAGNWKRIMTELRSGQYQPSPVKRVEIDKPDGGKRQLGIPTIVDRVIQQATAQVLTPIFDPTFSDNSFGFRPHRNGQQAVKQVNSIIKTGRRFAVDVDLSKFFDRVNHDLLMTYLGYKVKDKRLLKLIKRYLRAGFTFKAGRIQWHPKTLLKFKQQVRRLTNRNWGVSMHYQLFKLSQYLRGWINYFGIASGYQRCVELDHWIRRRVRMAYWRQWRKPRTKVRNLMKLGVHVQAAVACGITSRGPWRSAKSPGINQALLLDYLKSEGLYSLRDGWIALHYPK